ncbi:MAG: putative TIM-barrel fold metal-dependent hydrolase [Gammaproteobacteria bacterium]|jgi:predicted TIM-barrel fold metal-dependent hydrolase
MALNFDNIIDADGHILEPADAWEKYIDPEFRDRALRIRTHDGREVVEMDGKISQFFDVKILTMLGAMGKSAEELAAMQDMPYPGSAPFGSMDPKDRMTQLDNEGISKAILYPSLGLTWECEIEDPALSMAYAKAYNRWICDFCSDTDGRLIAAAHISLADPAAAAIELERAVREGAKGAFLAPYTLTRIPHAHPDHDAFWAKAQELDVPVAIHPMAEHPKIRTYQRFNGMSKAGWMQNALGMQGPQQAFYGLFQWGLFDRFPNIKAILLESGAGWIGAALDRMDTTYATTLGDNVPLKEKPSVYFKRQCWISGDPDERALAHVVDYVGNDRFFWATDYPHFDHPSNYMEELEGLVAPLSEIARNNLLGDSVANVYKL